jgi:hypothetical protein
LRIGSSAGKFELTLLRFTDRPLGKLAKIE